MNAPQLDDTPANQEVERVTNVLLIGSGWREHAIVRKLFDEPTTGDIHVLPGNPWMFIEWDRVISANVSMKDIASLIAYIRAKAIGLVIIGPEAPLCDGTADALRSARIPVFGPNMQGAQLEWDKQFAENFSKRHWISTPKSEIYDDEQNALEFLENSSSFPIVIKYPYLAWGKGVTIAKNKEEARVALGKCFDGKSYSNILRGAVIQEYLQGTEMSAFFFVDTKSKSIRYFSSAQDHKTRFESGYEGENPMTWGMGTKSPSPFESNPEIMKQVYEIWEKFLTGLLEDGIEYQGTLFAGLMVTQDGTVKNLEFNVRLWDPETESMLARMKSPLGKAMRAVAEGTGLADLQLEFAWKALALILADPAYPGSPNKGQLILWYDCLDMRTSLIYAGAKVNIDWGLVTDGGRVFALVVKWDDNTPFAELNTLAMSEAWKVTFWGKVPAYRKDIGK